MRTPVLPASLISACFPYLILLKDSLFIRKERETIAFPTRLTSEDRKFSLNSFPTVVCVCMYRLEAIMSWQLSSWANLALSYLCWRGMWPPITLGSLQYVGCLSPQSLANSGTPYYMPVYLKSMLMTCMHESIVMCITSSLRMNTWVGSRFLLLLQWIYWLFLWTCECVEIYFRG